MKALLQAGIGAQDRMLFWTDWPHYDADRIERVLNFPIPNDWKRKILSDNA